jgi:type IV pilus assembly protein PilQ
MIDGETAVIGGILVLDRGTTVTKVPYLAEIPLIGWLFKSNAVREEKRELLIFITPRIIKQDVI